MSDKAPEISDSVKMFAENYRWAASLATRWMNLEKSSPDVWKGEIAAHRQLQAGQSAIRMYAGNPPEFQSVSYAKPKETFMKEVKEHLKEMGFGKS